MRTYATRETILSCQAAVSEYTNKSKCLSSKLLVIPLTVVVCQNIVYTSNHKSLLLTTSCYHDVLLFPRKRDLFKIAISAGTTQTELPYFAAYIMTSTYQTWEMNRLYLYIYLTWKHYVVVERVVLTRTWFHKAFNIHTYSLLLNVFQV